MAIATNTLAPLSPSTALSPAQKCENPGEIESTAPPQPPYSYFNKKQKRLIVFIITFGATFSPTSSFIFFPIINALSASLRVSIEKVNLTITSYMIIAGIAPAIIGDMADMTGRRIVYLLTIGLYCAANIGLAVQSSWTALFVLRMLQSAGGAGRYF
jgi:MFS family permease